MYIILNLYWICYCITTRYGVDGTRIESQWRRDFPHPSRTALEPPSLL